MAYRYDNSQQTGNLLIQSANGNSLQGNNGESLSRLQVSVKVNEKIIPQSFPGLYASSDISLGNNDILKVQGQNGSAANVICADCGATQSNCVNGIIPDPTVKSLINQGSNSQITGKAYISKITVPPVPPLPSTQCSTSITVNCKIPLGSINGDFSLPRAVDLQNRQNAAPSSVSEPYYYEVNSISLGGQDVLTIDTSIAPIRLYISGNITMGGNTSMIHNGTPDRFSIFGTASGSQNFTINGGSQAISMFVYAPNATVKVNGGSNDPDILGALWVRTWDGSSSNQAEIRVPDTMPSLLESQFGSAYNLGIRVYSTTPVQSWTRKEVN